ncbi:IS630 family transposase, partial [Desulfobotulus sp. H1]
SGRPVKFQTKDFDELFWKIADKNPMDYGFPFALWTREMIREFIKKEFGVSISKATVGRLLKKIGFSPQKPLKKAWQRDEDRVKEWVQNKFPEIKKQAEKENAKIFFADESTVRSDYHSGTTWAPTGVTPVVEKTGARFGINMVSAITPSGELRFMTIDGKMDSDKFISFLKRLIYKADSPVFLIVDGHP